MAINPNIPLQGVSLDTATPLRQLGQDLRQGELMEMQRADQAQAQELRDLQIVGQRYANLDNREKSRINSVTMMAAELLPALESGNKDAVLSRLKSRRRNLQAQVADGLPVDTAETDRLIGMIEAGDMDMAKQSLKGQVQFGQALGILEDPRLKDLQIKEAEIGLQKADMDLDLAQRQLKAPSTPKLPDGVKLPEGFIPEFDEQGNLKGAKPIEGIKLGNLDPEKEIKMEQDLRKEVNSLNESFVKIRDAFGKIKSADASAAGDISLVIGYMKMLDPGSVVREGEFATAQNATGVPGRVRSIYNNLLEGTRLTPDQRADFLKQSQNIFDEQIKGYKQVKETYTGIAERAGLDVEDVIVEFEKQQEERLRFNPETGDFE